MGTMARGAWTRARAPDSRSATSATPKEPWGEPRVVIGIDADEAEYLAEFLDRDECAERGQVPIRQSCSCRRPRSSRSPATAQGPLQGGESDQHQKAPIKYSPALLSKPVALGRGRQSPDQARDVARELAGWILGELPGR